MRKSLIAILTVALLFCGCSNNPKDEKYPQKTDAEQSVEEHVEEKTESTTHTEESKKTEKPPEKVSSVSEKIIVIDPGHGINSTSKQEPIAPGSSKMKAGFVSGTSGANQTEEQLNLAVGLKLKAALEEKGAIVYMTRTTHECDVSNVQRAQMANELNADIAIRLHADGAENSTAHGVSVLVPGNQYLKDESLLSQSRLAGEAVLLAFAEETGALNRGISVRNDMTGFNWSEVPVILVEMGFMTNPEEDKLMETEEYQNKMVSGMVKGIQNYFEYNEAEK